jgi:hypothetical protein
MSSKEHKVEVVRDFLANQASCKSLTNFAEVGAVAGQMLQARSQRHISDPVSREKIAEVLHELDDVSVTEQGFMISALVTHYADNLPGHRFWEWAAERGLLDPDASAEDRKVFHDQQLQAVFAAYPEVVQVADLPPLPIDYTALYGDSEDEHVEDDGVEDYEDAPSFQ